MSITEVRELMELKGWSKTQLAAALDITDSAVYAWLTEKRRPSGPASILMRMWLKEAHKAGAAVNGRTD